MSCQENHRKVRTPAVGRDDLIVVKLRSDFEKFDFTLPPVPSEDNSQAASRRLSDVAKPVMKESRSVAVRKCIYERLPYAGDGNGFERMFIESLEADDKVLAHCRLFLAHHASFLLCHEGENAALAVCHPDFLVRTPHGIYMVETGAPPPLTHLHVQHRLKKAASWCEEVNLLDGRLRGGLPWHYVLLLEEAFRSWHAKGAFPSAFLAFAKIRPPEKST